jgi:hypothetical protein
VSRAALVGLATALVLWTALSLFWLIATPGEAHVCTIIAPEAAPGEPSLPPLTQAEWDELTHQQCDRPPSPLAILVFGTGYVLIIAGFLARADANRAKDGG